MSDLALPTPVVRPEAAVARETAVARTPILVLCCLAVLLGWVPRLSWGFWIDETATYWMASEGWRAAIDRTWDWPGQSILYSIVSSFFAVHGPWQEVLLRVPSVLGVLIAAWQVKRIAELLIAEEAGWYALVPFLCAPDIMSFATNARSYALALTASLIAFRHLLEWQRDGGQKNAALYFVASVLTVHFHYLFGFTLALQALYLVLAARSGIRIRWSLPAAVAVAVPLSLAVIAGSLRSAARQRIDFQAAHPVIKQWFQLVFPPTMLLALALGAGLVLLMVPRKKMHWNPKRLSTPVVALLATWMLAAPTIFFLVSWLTPNSMFASRYLLYTLPAFVLVVSWAVSSIGSSQARTIVMVAIFATNVLHPAMLLSAFRESPMSWREPLAYLAKKPADAPVFAASGFAHAAFTNWKTENPRSSPLFAPVQIYPIANPVIPLPYQFFTEVERFIEQKTEELAGQPTIFLLAEADSGLADWMTRHMRSRGYEAHTDSLNNFVVVEFVLAREVRSSP